MLRVLIVEDERPISELIRMSLTGAGYQCSCVYDGLAAADILEQETFDLILLDVMLPGADGFELMEYIRPREIPVIFLTARGSVADRVRGLKLGADDYLVKPFEIIELLARGRGRTGGRRGNPGCRGAHFGAADRAALPADRRGRRCAL